jgi:choline dehydrogenase-like flavoprotein
MTHYDVIGSGAGGGTLVHRLAPSGKQVLLLERGDRHAREPENWSAADVFVDNRCGELEGLPGHIGAQEHHLITRHAYLKNEIPVAGVAHQAGTCRFGLDPETSVLDVDCRAHEVDNLHVVDTSFFPSIGAVNHALTAMANAQRVGDHPLARLGVADREVAGVA